MNRSFRFYRVGGYDQLIQLYSSSGATLLDGEMVRHRETDRYVLLAQFTPILLIIFACDVYISIYSATFLVFDCIAINGKNYSQESLTDRLKRIRDLVVVPYRSVIEKGSDKVPLSFS